MPIRLLIALLSLAAVPAQAQSTDATCVLAGRIAEEGRWAPRLPGVYLLDAQGREVTAASREALSGVRQVRLQAPALLSRCDGDALLAQGPDRPEPKVPAPAVTAGVLPVEGVGYPRLARGGGQLVELRVAVPAERRTTLTR